MKRRPYTLFEMLLVMVMAAMLMTALMAFFHQGANNFRESVKNADICSRAILLRKQWREFVSGCPGSFEINGGIFKSGQNFAKSEDDALVLSSGGTERKFRFPVGTTFNFALEKSDGLADCAVLNVDCQKKTSMRIVACVKNQEK